MTLSTFQRIALGVAGATALAIGAFILMAPHAFYASYGIALPTDPNLLSELRAPGAGLATLGGLMLSGVFRLFLAPAAIAAALTVLIAFPAGRLVSLAMDGMPSTSVLGALGIEVAIAALCLVAFRPRATSALAGTAGQPG